MAHARNGKAWSLAGGIGVGICTATLWTLVAAVITGKLLDLEILSRSYVGYASLAILISSAWLGSMVSLGKTRRKKLMACIATGVGYLFVLLGTTAMFFGGRYEAVAVTALVIAGGSALALLSGKYAQKGSGRKNRRKVKK